MAELEKVVKLKIKKMILDLWPDAWHLMVVPTGFGQGGVPDHLACVPVEITPAMVGSTYGMLVGVEAKTKRGKPTALQLNQLAKITQAGGFAALTYGSEQVPELEQALRAKFCKK